MQTSHSARTPCRAGQSHRCTQIRCEFVCASPFMRKSVHKRQLCHDSATIFSKFSSKVLSCVKITSIYNFVHLSDCNFSLVIARQIWELVEDREAQFPMAAQSRSLLPQLRLQTVGLHSECLHRAAILILVNIRLDSNQSLFRMMK